MSKHLAHDAATNAEMILSEADTVAETLGLDDTLLDSLLVKLASK
jgi:hypothetical protein